MSDAAPEYRPVLVLTPPRPTDYQPRGGGRPKTSRPSRDRQGQRLDGAFDELERLVKGVARATVTDGLPEGDPELVVVFDVIDSTKDIADSLRSVGLEPLVDVEDEFDDDELGDDFARLRPSTPAPTEPIKRFLHASMANEEAVAQLLRLWRHWKTGRRMLRGFGPFTALFNQLYDVRPWGPADRIRSTGLADLLTDSLAAGLGDC